MFRTKLLGISIPLSLHYITRSSLIQHQNSDHSTKRVKKIKIDCGGERFKPQVFTIAKNNSGNFTFEGLMPFQQSIEDETMIISTQENETKSITLEARELNDEAIELEVGGCVDLKVDADFICGKKADINVGDHAKVKIYSPRATATSIDALHCLLADHCSLELENLNPVDAHVATTNDASVIMKNLKTRGIVAIASDESKILSDVLYTEVFSAYVTDNASLAMKGDECKNGEILACDQSSVSIDGVNFGGVRPSVLENSKLKFITLKI